MRISLVEAFNALKENNQDGIEELLTVHGIDVDKGVPGWTGIQTLSRRPWFSRLWTVQEVAISKDVLFICGKDSCEHDDLLRALYITQLVLGFETPGMSNTQLVYLQRQRYLRQDQQHLVDLLLEFSAADYGCLNPRDRVYALLSLQNKQGICELPIEYHQTVQDVYFHATRAILQSTRSLHFLHRRRFGVVENLPSWVPDWNSSSSQESINDSRMMFSSSDGLLHVLKDSFDVSKSRSLVVRGKIVARVTRTATHRFGIADYSEERLSEWIGALTLIPQVATELNITGPKDSNIAQKSTWIRWLLATTLTCGRFRPEDKELFDTENSDNYTDLPEVIKAAGPSYMRSLRKCVGRKLAMLDKWHLGLIPDYAITDDVVCVLNGSTTPLVLRQSGSVFEFIGECYVQAIMYGEVVNWLEGEGDKFEIV